MVIIQLKLAEIQFKFAQAKFMGSYNTKKYKGWFDLNPENVLEDIWKKKIIHYFNSLNHSLVIFFKLHLMTIKVKMLTESSHVPLSSDK